MFKQISLISVGVCLAALSFTSFAKSYHPSAQQLVNRCSEVVKLSAGKESSKTHSAWCIGYMQGVLDSNLFYNVYLSTKDQKYHSKIGQDEFTSLMNKHRIFCIPKAVTLGKIINLVVDYGKKNPKLMSKKASLMVYLALKDNFLCGKK